MSHLLAPMREKIVPVHGHMTAQRAGTRLDDGWLGTRSSVLYPSASEDQWDYLAQQPPNPATLCEKPHAEFMFGGGIEIGTHSFDAVGCADDNQIEFRVSAYIGGALAAYFGKWWGGESADVDDDYFERGRVKKAWFGVLGTPRMDCRGLVAFLQRCRAGRREESGLRQVIRASAWMS